jgi:hypothetical protein
MAPILFCIYIDEMFKEIKQTKVMIENFSLFHEQYQELLKEGTGPEKIEKFFVENLHNDAREMLVQYVDDTVFVFAN